MKLPEPIFSLAKKHFACHGCWHELRRVNSPEFQKIRDECFPRGELWPNGLRSIQQTGCGEDFLRFHRQMIRNFKWVVNNAPPPKYEYLPWEQFPCWVAEVLDAMDPFYRGSLARTLDDMTSNAELDDLGQFIEGETSDAAHIHWLVHGIVHDYEESHFGNQPESDMGDFNVAALNQHFWGLHGWIDEIYAGWQVAHGQLVDLSPLEPDMRRMCHECEKLNENSLTWLSQWRKFLRLRSE